MDTVYFRFVISTEPIGERRDICSRAHWDEIPRFSLVARNDSFMKILLIGKNGQLGSEIDRQAKHLEFKIHSFGREELDITDYKSVRRQIEKHKPDFVVNASAYHVVPDCEAYPDKAFAVNALALKNLADICKKCSSTLVHYSTDYVFDGFKQRSYREDDMPHPLQIYGISKLVGEQIVLQYALGSIVIRTSGLYGGKGGSRAKKGNFVLTILKQIKGKKGLEVSSEQIVSPTYAADIALATLKLLQNRSAKGIFHLVNEGFCSWAEFASEIVKIKRLPTKIIPVDRKGMAGSLRRPLFSALKNTRASKLGVKLPSWQDALRRYLITLN